MSVVFFVAIISIYLLIFEENSKEGMQWVSINSQAFNKNGLAEKATHLIMVAGHSVTISGTFFKNISSFRIFLFSSDFEIYIIKK